MTNLFSFCVLFFRSTLIVVFYLCFSSSFSCCCEIDAGNCSSSLPRSKLSQLELFSFGSIPFFFIHFTDS